ncbi:SH3 domain-containing protein [Spirulina subsalsa FACHB-351]|uniref:SH3 domain-containing protein n=1 Tax=Spirulina subsalsa FACHB-351 TaxID=234711 RepID=A0ABT3L7D0_9CYAN|nr:SH3 domain-containing protein [Spirulina subsalsa]MCW6037417.1 SH3 domain-containing protein [Spirulina subsalsa FACHB-351]
MNLTGLAQFFLGIFSGLILFGISGFIAGYYVLSGMASTPARPIFPEERPQAPPPPSPSPAAQTPEPPTESAPEPSPEPPAPEPEPETLEPGAYRARVNWPDGLSLRATGAEDGERIGGIAYNQEMIVLRTSDDGRWQEVRLPGSNQRGWVKAGNADRINED